MIDVHTHVLPSIDDGPKEILDTVSMIKEAKQAGFTDIITTSHYIENAYDVSKKSRQKIINAIKSLLKEEKINIKLYNGAEAYITNNLLDFIKNDYVPTLAESRYVLFELPLSGPQVIYIDSVIEDLITAKYVPIIAHPERYEIVKKDPNIATSWVRKGALLQANYGSIIEKYGKDAKQALIKLLEANAIHFLGTDAHRPESIYTQMDKILSEYKNIIDEEKLNELTTQNPKKILGNEKIVIEEPEEIKIKKHWFRR